MSVPTGIALAAVELTSGDAIEEEKVLVARARAGDRMAFEALVRQHADHLYAVVLRLSTGRPTPRRPPRKPSSAPWRAIGTFRGQSRFFTWLYRIGVNEAKRIAERRARLARLSHSRSAPSTTSTTRTPGPESRAEHAELRTQLERAVRCLPEAYRAPVVLRDIEGMSTTEAAEALGLREAAFKSRLHRGRLALRQELSEYLTRVSARLPAAR